MEEGNIASDKDQHQPRRREPKKLEPGNVKVELDAIVKAHVVSQIVTETVKGA